MLENLPTASFDMKDSLVILFAYGFLLTSSTVAGRSGSSRISSLQGVRLPSWVDLARCLLLLLVSRLLFALASAIGLDSSYGFLSCSMLIELFLMALRSEIRSSPISSCSKSASIFIT